MWCGFTSYRVIEIDPAMCTFYQWSSTQRRITKPCVALLIDNVDQPHVALCISYSRACIRVCSVKLGKVCNIVKVCLCFEAFPEARIVRQVEYTVSVFICPASLVLSSAGYISYKTGKRLIY